LDGKLVQEVSSHVPHSLNISSDTLNEIVADVKSNNLKELVADIKNINLNALPNSVANINLKETVHTVITEVTPNLHNVTDKISLQTVEKELIKSIPQSDLKSITDFAETQAKALLAKTDKALLDKAENLAETEGKTLLAKADKALVAKAESSGIPVNKEELEHLVISKINAVANGQSVYSIPITQDQVNEAKQVLQKIRSSAPVQEIKKGLIEVNKIEDKVITEIDSIKDKIITDIETKIEKQIETKVASEIPINSAQQAILIKGIHDYRAQEKLEKAQKETEKPKKEKHKKKKSKKEHTHGGVLESLLEKEILES